ncbi:transposase [Trichonephila clavipes]|nr:transposase [Trichonephila clavipes]
MARGAIFWSRHLSIPSKAIDSLTKEFSVRFSQFKELSERLKLDECLIGLDALGKIKFWYRFLSSELRASLLGSDEAHFWLNGYVNNQNCRIWSEANPQVYVKKPLHPEKLTIWCALWAGGIRYRAMITNFFTPELNNHDVQELWFQQDGATCHTARATIDLLKDTFGDRLISRFDL